MNKREIRVIGCKRSGHHAVVFWIGNHIGDEVIYITDVYPGKKPNEDISIEGYPVLFFNIGNGLQNSVCPHNPIEISIIRSLYMKSKKYNFNHLKQAHYSFFDCQEMTCKDCLILSFEDWLIEDISNEQKKEKHDKWYGKSGRIDHVLVLRDPFNTIASKIKGMYMTFTDNMPWKPPIICIVRDCVKKWKNHAKEYLGNTNILKNLTKINFNRWHINSDYRISIMKQLNIEKDPKPYQRMSDFMCGGSSFSGLEKDGKASELDLFNRYKYYLNNPDYMSIFEDKELLEMSEEIFGNVVD